MRHMTRPGTIIEHICQKSPKPNGASRFHRSERRRLGWPVVFGCAVLVGIGSVCFPGEIVAQEKETGEWSSPVFHSPDEYDQFMGNLKRVAYGPNGSPELRAMVPMLNDIVLNKPIGSTAERYGIEATPLDLLADPDIRAELEMVDEQYESLQKMEEQIQRETARRIQELDFSRPDELVKTIRAIRSDADEQLASLLLPHQLERLRMLRLRTELGRSSLADVLTRDPLRSELELTDEQVRELRESEREIEAQLERDIARLRRQARRKLLSRLKPSQQEKVEELLGDLDDIDSSPMESKSKSGSRRKR